MLPRSYLLLLEPDIHNHGLQLWSDFDLSEFHEFYERDSLTFCDLRIFTLFEEYIYMCVCARIFIPMILPSAYLSDVSFLEMFGAFWSLFDFVTRYSHVLGQWDGEHGPLQHCSLLQLWVFGCFQNMSNVCS